MWLPLVAHTLAAGAAGCTGWIECPVAAGLHPVAWDPVARWHVQLQEVMAGRRASPAFSPALTTADVHWRLASATGVGLRLPPDTRQSWQDYAVAGSLLAADGVLGEIASRSEEVDALRTAFDLILDPSAELVVGRDGRVQLSHPTGGVASRWLRRREAAVATDDLDAGRRTPPVRIGLSAGWTLREPDAPADQPLLSWAAQLTVRNAGLTLWRLDVDLLELRWDATARQRVWEDLSVGATLRSEAASALPNRWTAGLYWSPRPQVVVSTTWSQPLDAEGWRVDAALRVELGAFLPGRLHPSLAGLPAVRDRTPNVLTAWTRAVTPP